MSYKQQALKYGHELQMKELEYNAMQDELEAMMSLYLTQEDNGTTKTVVIIAAVALVAYLLLNY